MSYRITVDTGGTFTDMVVANESGRQVIGKAPTTPERIFNGMKDALDSVAGELGVAPEQLLGEASILIYGTTRATNAIVQGKVAKTAFLTTLALAATAADRTRHGDKALHRPLLRLWRRLLLLAGDFPIAHLSFNQSADSTAL